VTVQVAIPVDFPLVLADRAAMLLALDNLVDNAIRYSSDHDLSPSPEEPTALWSS